MRPRSLFLLLSLLAVAACAGADGRFTNPDSGEPVELAVALSTLGADSARPGDTVQVVATVSVVAPAAAAAAPDLSGLAVNFLVLRGGGSVFAPVVLTNGSGTAQQPWTLGSATNTWHVLEARLVDSTGTPVRVSRDSVWVPAPAPPVLDFRLLLPADTALQTEVWYDLAPWVVATWDGVPTADWVYDIGWTGSDGGAGGAPGVCTQSGTQFRCPGSEAPPQYTNGHWVLTVRLASAPSCDLGSGTCRMTTFRTTP